jgi:hypothetical protein
MPVHPLTAKRAMLSAVGGLLRRLAACSSRQRLRRGAGVYAPLKVLNNCKGLIHVHAMNFCAAKGAGTAGFAALPLVSVR